MDINQRLNAIGDELKKAGMGYTPEESITTYSYHINPCDKTLVSHLNQTILSVESLQSDLKKENRIEDANKFSNDLKKNLYPLKNELALYCDNDQAVISACFQKEATATFIIISNVKKMTIEGKETTTPALETIFVPFSVKHLSSNKLEYGIYRDDFNVTEFKVLYPDQRNFTAALESNQMRDFYNNHRQALKEASLCLNQEILVSKIGKKIRTFSATAAVTNF